MHASTAPRPIAERRIDRALFQAGGKPDDRAARAPRRADHVYDDGLHHRRQSANPRASRHARRRRAVRHLHFLGGRVAGHGPVCELPNRAGAGNVSERVLHVFGLPGNAHPLANGARRCIFFRRAVLLTVTRVREQIVNGIANCLSHPPPAGMGMFIAFVGMRSAKLVVANPATFVGIGNFSDREVQAACLGLVLTLVLMVRKVNGAILLGILGTTLYGIFRGMAHWPVSLVAMPHPSSTLLQLDLRSAAHLGLLEITFAFLFVDLFDNVGTLVGVCEQAGFVKDGKIPGVGRALLADAVGTVFGSLTGTSTVTSYMRAPQSIAKVKWEEYTDAFPAFVTMAATPLTFSIATGLSLGLISFTIVKIAAGKFREVS